MSQSIALPRLRIRRRRPPSDRELLAIMQAAEALGWFALAVVKIATQAWLWPFYVLIGALWITVYLKWRHLGRRARWHRERGDPWPVHPSEWLVFAVGLFAQAVCWGLAIG